MIRASLDGPVCHDGERTAALFDQKSRNRTKFCCAIRKVLDRQIQGTGFSFVEVLAECPTHLKLEPRSRRRRGCATSWCRTYPLGVLKSVQKREAAFRWGAADVRRQRRVRPPDSEAWTESPACASRRIPGAPPRRVTFPLKLAGAGGDARRCRGHGARVRSADRRGRFDAAHIPSYGPESRGRTSSRGRARGARGGALARFAAAARARRLQRAESREVRADRRRGRGGRVRLQRHFRSAAARAAS